MHSANRRCPPPTPVQSGSAARPTAASGGPPIGRGPQVGKWVAVYGVVAPTPGARCLLERPYMPPEGCQSFVEAFAAALPDSFKLLVVDHRGAPTAQRRTLPANGRLGCVPPYGPELNPSARVWRDLNEALAWLQPPRRTGSQPRLRGSAEGLRPPRGTPSWATPLSSRQSRHYVQSKLI
jgi:hypothetical protein